MSKLRINVFFILILVSLSSLFFFDLEINKKKILNTADLNLDFQLDDSSIINISYLKTLEELEKNNYLIQINACLPGKTAQECIFINSKNLYEGKKICENELEKIYFEVDDLVLDGLKLNSSCKKISNDTYT